MVLGNVEDECCFSTLSFMKSKLQKWLITHLDLVMRMLAQDHYTLDTFPFGDAIKDYAYNKVRYAADCQIFSSCNVQFAMFVSLVFHIFHCSNNLQSHEVVIVCWQLGHLSLVFDICQFLATFITLKNPKVCFPSHFYFPSWNYFIKVPYFDYVFGLLLNLGLVHCCFAIWITFCIVLHTNAGMQFWF